MWKQYGGFNVCLVFMVEARILQLHKDTQFLAITYDATTTSAIYI